MSLIYRFNGQTLQGSTDAPLPGTTGYDDVSCATVGLYTVAYDNIKHGTYAMSGRTIPVIRFVDNALGGEPFWSAKPGTYPSSAPSSITGAYSMRMYYRRPTTTTTAQPIIRFQNNNTTSLYLYYSWVSPNARVRTSSSSIGTAITGSNATAMLRIELQVDPARSPKVICRVYLEDGTTPISSFNDNPTNTLWNNFDIGHFLSGNYSASEVVYSSIEVHDDYDLGGQFTSNPTSPTAASETATGVASSLPTVATAYNYDTSTRKTLPNSTLVDGTHYTKTLNIDYTTAGTYDRKLDLYVPTGTPPAGGWPIVVWAHSGFFTNGYRTELPDAWRDDLLEAGYAVATVEYVLSSIDAVSPYESYGTFSDRFRGGRYPSHILDFKRAAAFLRDNAGTYGIDDTKMFATGFSAGGYVALGAAVTSGLSADGDGKPMTLAAATTAGNAWSDGYTGSDPVFAGAFVYAGVVSMDLARAWDPTFPNAGGIVNVASRAFQGLLQTGTAAPDLPAAELDALIALNAANVPDVAYVEGTADYLVHWAHEDALAAAMAGSGVAGSYDHYTTPNNHDRANLIYDRTTIINWLDARTGGGAVDATHNAGAVGVTVAVPAPTVTATGNASHSPSAVGVTVAVPAPTVSTAGNATINPSAVARTASVPSPVVSGAASVSVAAVARTVAVPTPTVSASASVSTAVVARTVAVPAPSVTTAGNATVNAAVLAETVAIPSPVVSGGAITMQAVVARTVAVPAPTVTAVSNATVTPSAIGVTVAVPAPVVSAGGSTTVSAGVVGATALVPSPSVQTSALLAQSSVGATVSVPAPVVQTAGNATVSAPVVAATAAVPAPSVSVGGSATYNASPVSISTSVQSTSVAAGATIAPAAVSVVGQARTTSQTAAGSVSAGVVNAAATVPTPTVQTAGSTTTTPGTVAATASVPAPTITTTVMATPGAVAASVSAQPATPSSSKYIDVGTVAATASVHAPLVVTGSRHDAGAVSSSVSVPVPVVQTGGGVVVTVATVTVTVGEPAPTITSFGNASPSPGSVAASVGVPAPSIRTDARFNAAAITIDAHATFAAASAAGQVTVVAPLISAGVSVLAATVSAGVGSGELFLIPSRKYRGKSNTGMVRGKTSIARKGT